MSDMSDKSDKPVILVTRKLPDAVEARLQRDYRPILNPDDRLYSALLDLEHTLLSDRTRGDRHYTGDGRAPFQVWIWLQAAQLKAHGKRLLCRCKADVIRDGHFRLHLILCGLTCDPTSLQL